MAEAVEEAARAAERAARLAYGRLVATLTAQTRDIAAAEDALSEAFARALETWPKKGVPNAPEAWLLTAARRKQIDHARRRITAASAEPDILRQIEDAAMDERDPNMPDPRLGLLFLCAHPAIDQSVRTPLMMQTVLGLDAARIAKVYLVKPATMSARLVRAKTKIKDAGIPFEIQDMEAWAERLDSVLSAIYGAYTAGWAASAPGEAGTGELAEEAEWLARLIVSALPESGEAKGLLALILFCESRTTARKGPRGEFIPLGEQDTTLWDEERVEEANTLLREAATAPDSGRFQIEAAVQSVHAMRSVTGRTDWTVLLALYTTLMGVAPSLGAAIARAAVMGELGKPDDGLADLAALPEDRIADYCPYFATRGHLMALSGRASEARAALLRARELATDPAVQSWLKDRADALSPN
ncbi:MAG: DUF6596 domain-containing protein [Pseudomonadota bacterium]